MHNIGRWPDDESAIMQFPKWHYNLRYETILKHTSTLYSASLNQIFSSQCNGTQMIRHFALSVHKYS